MLHVASRAGTKLTGCGAVGNRGDNTSTFGVDGEILCIIMFHLFSVAATRNFPPSYYGRFVFVDFY